MPWRKQDPKSSQMVLRLSNHQLHNHTAPAGLGLKTTRHISSESHLTLTPHQPLSHRHKSWKKKKPEPVVLGSRNSYSWVTSKLLLLLSNPKDWGGVIVSLGQYKIVLFISLGIWDKSTLGSLHKCKTLVKMIFLMKVKVLISTSSEQKWKTATNRWC